MKYKVGDKVKVKEDLEMDEQYGEEYTTPEMVALGGEEGVIMHKGRVGYNLDIDDEEWVWTDEMLEPVGFPEEWSIRGCKELSKYLYNDPLNALGLSGIGKNAYYYKKKGKENYWLASGSPIGEAITFEQFKNYILKEEGKKLIGYKVKESLLKETGGYKYLRVIASIGWMHDLIKKNDITKEEVNKCLKDPVVLKNFDEYGFKELYLEPIYKETEKVLKFGNVECTIKSNKGADTDHGFIPVEDIKKALHYIDNPPKLAGFELNQRFSKDSFGYQKVKFGCVEGRIGDFRQILIEIENYGK